MNIERLRIQQQQGVSFSGPARARALTIGNFDGVHLGHQQMLERVIARARQRDLWASVMIFEPHASEFFQPSTSGARISRLHEKCAVFKQMGVDEVIVVRFNQRLAELSAAQFVRDLVQNRLMARYVLIGDDFRFGARRQGDYDFLRHWFEGEPFEVEQLSQIQSSGERISSTRIRLALKEGRLADAQRLLGRTYTLSARVEKGQQLGRTLGFPTANLHLRWPTPLAGVFVTRVRWRLQVLYGMCNVGWRPSVDQSPIQRVEVHVFDFVENIYGETLDIEFLYFLRPEQRFASLQALQTQLTLDRKLSRDFLEGMGLG
jgi:riboflavin kinase/FMN adenylyltransferase